MAVKSFLLLSLLLLCDPRMIKGTSATAEDDGEERRSSSSSSYSYSAEEMGKMVKKLSAVLIPGFASSQLRAWAMLDCPFSPLDIKPLDSIWLDTRKVISITDCWLKCMLLDPYDQKDHPECKSRPDLGLLAITELDPGYITGPLSSVWREWVHWCVEFGIDSNGIVAVPYDWRLPGFLLEERDMYFHKLRLAFETNRKLRGGPALVFAHSMGNNVFRYFLEWLKFDIAPKLYQQWIDDHIFAYFAVGGPWLGSAETLKASLSGLTFGIPIPEGSSRFMCNSFGSSLWMLPFSKNCYTSKKICGRAPHGTATKSSIVCNADEYTSKFSGWPVPLAKIDVPTVSDKNHSINLEKHQAVADCSEGGAPIRLSFSAREVADGTLFHEIEHLDPNSKVVLHQLHKFYLDDPIHNSLSPWERPPIQNVFCIYGVNSKTEVGYHFASSGKAYPDNWIISDIIYETENGNLQSRSGAEVDGNPGPMSGDSTIPYHSLSWCKTWLGSRVNVTRTPQGAHDGSDVQVALNVEHEDGADIVPNMAREDRFKYITYYEDSISIPGRKTAVWELDKVNHRNAVRSHVLMREMWLEILHAFHPDAKGSFLSKGPRDPVRNDDCYWDYGKARCAFPEFCEYRYVFGDVHLGQSCRVKASTQHVSNFSFKV